MPQAARHRPFVVVRRRTRRCRSHALRQSRQCAAERLAARFDRRGAPRRAARRLPISSTPLLKTPAEPVTARLTPCCSRERTEKRFQTESLNLLACARATCQVQVQKRQKKGTFKMIEDGKKAPDFTLPDDTGASRPAFKAQGPPGRRLFLSKGRHVRVHAGGQRFLLPRRTNSPPPAPKSSASRPIAPRATRNSRPSTTCRVRLLADEQKEAAEAYGVWVEKSMYGRKYMGVERSTFLIDKSGKLAQKLAKGEGSRPRRGGSCGGQGASNR